MRAVIQRVTEASVSIAGKVAGACGRGYVVLLGVGEGDTEEEVERLWSKIWKLRIFPDGEHHTGASLGDVEGEVLVVSQFTLYADTSHGRRPGFSTAARPEIAEPLYERFVADLRGVLGRDRVGTGRFGADMKVALVNDGPCSFELKTED